MNEKPILFSAPMVRALLAGAKTQTRRAFSARTMKLMRAAAAAGEVSWFMSEGLLAENDLGYIRQFSPYGQSGDRLWVRETFSGPHCMEAYNGCAAVPPSMWGELSSIWYWSDGNPAEGDWTRPRPSIHMPRWASRILLEVTAVRVERLQDISERDAVAEGVTPFYCGFLDDVKNPTCWGVERPPLFDTPTGAYRALWESINSPDSWAVNPWVWVVEFKRVQP